MIFGYALTKRAFIIIKENSVTKITVSSNNFALKHTQGMIGVEQINQDSITKAFDKYLEKANHINELKKEQKGQGTHIKNLDLKDIKHPLPSDAIAILTSLYSQ